MSGVELEGFGIAIADRTPIAGLDLVLHPGAALAIVGRSGAGKTALAEALAGRPSRAQLTGRRVLPRRIALLRPTDDLAALERQLARRPELIVADEPGATLDPAPRHALLTALLTAARDLKASLIILTRDIRLPLTAELDIAVLSGGTIVERASSATIADRPRHDATRELLAAERPRTRTLARPPVGETLLELDAVTSRFPGALTTWLRRTPATVALDGVGFAVRRGEAVGILGGAGAGKSVLLRLIAGLGRAQSGQLAFARQPYRGSDLPHEAQVRMAMVLPNPHAAFNPDLPVGLTLTEPLRVEEQLLIDEQADGLAEAVRLVGFEPDILDRLPQAFTPPQLQRLALARALVGRPSLILLDEPTAALDPVDQAEFLTLFNRIRADYGITVLVASRRLAVLRLLADRVHVLDHGKLVETGTPTQLQQESTHAATRALLGSPYPGPLPIAVPAPEPAPVQPEPVVEAAAAAAAEPEPRAEASSVVEPPAVTAPLEPTEAVVVDIPPDPGPLPAAPNPVPPEAPTPAPDPTASSAEAAHIVYGPTIPLPPVKPETKPEPPDEQLPLPPPRSRPSVKPADERAESGEAQFAVEGRRNRAGRVEASDDDAWG